MGAGRFGVGAGIGSRRGERVPRSRHGCQIRILARRALVHANLRVPVVEGLTVAGGGTLVGSPAPDLLRESKLAFTRIV